MKKQFATYEISLKLKELGFGINEEYIQLLYYYDLDANLILNKVGVKRKLKPYRIGAYTIDDFEAYLVTTGNSSEDFILAPLWQQVIDWFREKHDLFILITPPNGVVFVKYSETRHTLGSIFPLNSYEEARERAILKAIEIIKNKQS